jgi:uncharacterized protein
MNLQEKALEVRRVFEEVDIEIDAYLSESKLGCISGCGFCCANPKVMATVLEFVPFAFDLFERGIADQVYERLEKIDAKEFCIVYRATSEDGASGFCSEYKNRGMICRVFASTARTNKEGKKELITCKNIKEQKREWYELASRRINEGLDVPLASGAYNRLIGIDFDLTREQFPINQAIKKALEAVLRFQYYRENQD